MAERAVKPLTIDADLYNDLMDALSPSGGLTTNERDRLYGRLGAVLLDDWCCEDGEGYCTTHDDRIEYWVDNFGPEGKVLATGPYAPAISDMDTCFPVCPGAQAHRYGVSPGDPAHG